ncbi:MAG: M13-type metalloendopeptidase [Actinomycetaceae bacterium]|nr:M13-type metalloendopeptidase [Actinomycetaceae bacterium]
MSTETNPLLSTVDPAGFDPRVRPQDDLFSYVNGPWLDTHEIAADRPIDGSFYQLRDQAERNTHAIIEDCCNGTIQGESATQIASLFLSFMDEGEVEKTWEAGLAALVAPLMDAQNHLDLARALASAERVGISGLVSLDVDVDLNDSERYSTYIFQSGLGLPERAYYLEDTYAQIREAYVQHIAAMVVAAKWHTQEQATSFATSVMEVETALAKIHWDNVKTREADLINNPMNWDEFTKASPGFPWEDWRKNLDIPSFTFDRLIVGMPDVCSASAALWSETDLEDLRAWALWKALNDVAGFLSQEIVDLNFDFYGRTLQGSAQLRARWKRGVSLVERFLGEALGRIYVDRHFPPENKALMQDLVSDLVEAYRTSISELEWLGEETKAKALEKLGTFDPKIGYPTKWRDYSGLELKEGTLLQKIGAATRFETDYWLAKLRKDVDRTEWLMTPQTVNAYYNPTKNEIVFPAAILQPPFFDPRADLAINYGAIGAVIGHEIGHGFDDQGSKYDALGELKDWWTPTDRESFEARTLELIAQYGAYTPRGLDAEHKVNGALTIGENIGDLGGLAIAWKAYTAALARQGLTIDSAPEIEGMSAAQRFFFSWARVWRTKARPEFAIQLLAIDPHSPAEFRCNGVVCNMDQFAQAFDLKDSDQLWKEPSNRITIW